MKFDSEIKKGNFVIGSCPNCNKVVWPPSELCNGCFGKIIWKKASQIGNIVEYSKKDNEDFCIAEFEGGIRIMGTLVVKSKKPEVGSKVKLEKCGITGENYIFVMNLL